MSVQQKVEELTFEFIDDIADEFGIPIKNYPEVYWIGKDGVSFDEVFLPPEYKEFFENNRLRGHSFTFDKYPVVCISLPFRFHIAEEAAHFVHNSSYPRFFPHDDEDSRFNADIFSEMLGYFGSKIICPSRRSSFAVLPDYENLTILQQSRLISHLWKVGNGFMTLYDFYVHQKGYKLGEALYQSYSTGNFSSARIAYLFRREFSSQKDITSFLDNLREELFRSRK